MKTSANSTRTALRVTFIFVVFSLLWIVFSDRVLHTLIADAALAVNLQSAKAAVYVLVVGLLIYTLVRSALGERDEQTAAVDSEQRRFLATFDAVPVGIAHLSLDFEYTWVNRKLQQMLGYAAQELYELGAVETIHPDDRARERDATDRLLREEVDSYALELRLVRKDGSVFWSSMRRSLVRDHAGNPMYLVAAITDITDRRMADEAQRQAANMLAALQEAVLIADASGRILRVNPAFNHITGFKLEQLEPKYWLRLIDTGKTDRDNLHQIAKLPESDQPWKGELWCRHKDGGSFPALVSATPYHDPLLPSARFLAVFSDISRYKQDQAQLAYLSAYDSLTALNNRNRFKLILDDLLDSDQRRSGIFWLYSIGLDRFRSINQSFGSEVGNRVLKEVARRLLRLANSERVARLDGDEFAVVLESTDSDVDDASQFALELQAALSEPYEIGDQQLYLTPGIGIAGFPGDADSADGLLRSAEAAMIQAKQSGRQGLRFFSAELNQEARERVRMVNLLRQAQRKGELSLVYQPRWTRADNCLAVEALLRWNSPELGQVRPDRFIPLAEESGLIQELGRWVLKEACQQAAHWRAAGLKVRIGVNLSQEQLRNADLVQAVRDILAETGLEPQHLELEITESAVAFDPEASVAILQSLKDLGVSLAVDDFGTGYSSMSYLKRFPVDYLKIDRSFVDGIPEDPDNDAIVRAIVALATALRLEVVAEGVETEEQLRFLTELGVHELQGYYIARPLPAADAEAFLRHC